MADESSAPITAQIRYDDAPEDCRIELGGDSSNPTWEEYLDSCRPELRRHLIAIRDAVVLAGLENTTAEHFCNDAWFSCSDGLSVTYTWRAWGDLLQAIHNKREGYMKYYM